MTRMRATITAIAMLSLVCGAAASACDGSSEDAPKALDASSDNEPGAEVDGDGRAPVPPTPKEACEAYYRAACARYAECGIRINCDSYLLYCPDILFAPGSTRTVEGTIACAAARRNQSCDALQVDPYIAPACATPGTRDAGEPCSFHGQCASNLCSPGSGQCGTCLAVRPPGTGCPGPGETCGWNASCVNEDAGCQPIALPTLLAPGQACPQDSGVCPYEAPCARVTPDAPSTCARRPNAGDACLFAPFASSAAICATGTYCAHVDGSANGTCTVPSQLDAPCVETRCAEGLFCDPVSKVCHGPVGAGARCGIMRDDAGHYLDDVPCGDRLKCEDQAADGGLPDERCVPILGVGDPCDVSRPCSGTLQCGATGTCEVPPCVADAGPG